jgi:cysteine desulfurase
MKIYADNAATTKLTKTALSAMLPYLEESYGNPSSPYSFGMEAKEAIENARAKIANVLGCTPKEITFTSGGSESDNQAIISAANLGAKVGKKHIISSVFEHHAVLHTLEKLHKEGFEITLLDVSENGIISPEQVASAIRQDTCLVTIMFANNEIGTVEPIFEIGKICKEKGVLFHTDAVQAAGHLHINVAEQNIDLLSLSAHKFGGPKGAGILYAKRGVLLSNLIEGGGQERGKRAGTENVPAIVGMAAALEEANENIDKNAEKSLKIRNKIIVGLSEIPHSALNGDRIKRLPGNINFCFEGIEGESLIYLLDNKGICASSGSACTSGSLDPSHVLLAIGRDRDTARGSLRLTISPETTEEEADYIVNTVKDTVEKLRELSPVWQDIVNGKREYKLP